jgi:glycyl-tRNA synthetase beta chain
LNARLADARFFFDEDLKVPLADRIGDLKRVVFHEKLGTVYDKTLRIEAITEMIADVLSLTETDKSLPI